MQESVSNKRALEANLHRELMSSSRKYIQELGIVSVIGMLELVKQETIELEHATKHEVKSDSNERMF